LIRANALIVRLIRENDTKIGISLRQAITAGTFGKNDVQQCRIKFPNLSIPDGQLHNFATI